MFLRSAPSKELPSMPEIRLEGSRLYLRPPRRDDWHEWAWLRSRNRAFLQPWEPTWADDALSEDFFEARIRRQTREWKDDRAYPFVICLNGTEKIIGGMNINNISRGAAQFASLGYWLAEDAQGHGYMTEAGRVIIQHAFTDLRLHRLNAGCLPENVRSRSMLSRLGFREEGFAARFIQIDGLWRDHVLYGLPVEEWEKRDILV